MKESFIDVLDNWLLSRLTDIHTIIPGRISQYYGHEKRKAKIELSIKYKTKDGHLLEYPLIDNVPVVFPSSSDFSLVFPLKEKDGVLVVFSEVGIGNYLNSDNVVESDSIDRFDLSDAIAIPGLWSFNTAPAKPENDTDLFINYKNFSMTSDGDNFKIKGKQDTIEATGGTIKMNSFESDA